MPEELSDIHILGSSTQESRLTVEQCPQLAQAHIKHVGLIDAAEPMHIFRRNTSGTFMLACREGQGEVMLEGEWHTLAAGEACLSPAQIQYGLRAMPGHRWKFCWVRYQEGGKDVPALHPSSPVAAKFDCKPLWLSIEGLQSEQDGHKDPAALALWIELVHLHVVRFAQGHKGDDRLTRLWERVHVDLSSPWSLEEMARTAGLSREHLRRLCIKELGRSPLQHLLTLRMRRAMQLISSTEDKMEFVAEQVGYGDIYSFSKAFRRWSGFAPSAFRKIKCGSGNPSQS